MQTLEEACRDWESRRPADTAEGRSAWDNYYPYLAEHCPTDKFKNPQGDRLTEYLLKMKFCTKVILFLTLAAAAEAMPFRLPRMA